MKDDNVSKIIVGTFAFMVGAVIMMFILALIRMASYVF